MELKKLGFGIILFFFLGGAFAGVLDYYGTVEGAADVEGPIFYANLTQKETNELIINEEPLVSKKANFSDGNTLVFWSRDLGKKDFNYVPQCKFSVKINSSNSSAVELSCYHDNTLSSNKICSSVIETGGTLKKREASCEGDSSLSDVNNIIYEIKGGGDPEVIYTVETSPSGATKLQVTKK